MIHRWRLILFVCLAWLGWTGVAYADAPPRQVAQVLPEPKKLPPGEVTLTLLAAESAAASGLLDRLTEQFFAKAGIKIRIVPRRVGELVDLARQGQGDVIMFDDPDSEDVFLRARLGIEREDVMYAELIVVGPRADPAGVSGMVSVIDALRQISFRRAPFVTRNDDSGMHRLERRIWDEVGIVPELGQYSWYRPSDGDMRTTLRLAAQLNGYTITDMATWLAFKERRNLVNLVGDDPRLQLRYSIVLLNPERFPKVHANEARAFMRWLTSREGQNAIQSFKVEDELPYSPHLDSKE